MRDRRITYLLQQRKLLWNRFQQLRSINPDEAAIARDAAISFEKILASEGFKVTH